MPDVTNSLLDTDGDWPPPKQHYVDGPVYGAAKDEFGPNPPVIVFESSGGCLGIQGRLHWSHAWVSGSTAICPLSITRSGSVVQVSATMWVEAIDDESAAESDYTHCVGALCTQPEQETALENFMKEQVIPDFLSEVYPTSPPDTITVQIIPPNKSATITPQTNPDATITYTATPTAGGANGGPWTCKQIGLITRPGGDAGGSGRGLLIRVYKHPHGKKNAK